MYNVQKELHDLREKMHRNETVENKNEKIKKIEEERDWYRKEALRLDAFTTSMTKDLKYMREKLESIEEDRGWLEKQLKACKKQNKLLRAELDVRVTSGTTQAFDTPSLPAFDSPKAGSGMLRKLSKRDGSDDNGTCLPQLNADPATPTLAEEREEKFRKQIRQLKKEINQKNQELHALRRQRVVNRDDDERTHLENFFLQCIESVKDEVLRRRTRVHDKREASMVRNSMADRMKNQKYDVGAEFEDFSATDRVRVIERLLAHDEVLTLIYEQLFPPKSSRSNKDRPATTDGEIRSMLAPQLSPSDSTQSLPEPSTPNRRVSFESSGDGRLPQPVGSGVAVARATGLQLDDSTREYLRSMYVSQGIGSLTSPTNNLYDRRSGF
ncbi:hypothetical protein PINS_up015004 [Pythium insidiosum]|nr:hypothetical protein PINS_up015004 [Pythium insidiosum]